MSSESSKRSRQPRTGLSFSLRLGLFYAAFFVFGYLGVIGASDYLLRISIASGERALVGERLAGYRAWFRNGQTRELLARFEEQSRDSEELEFVYLAGPTARRLIFSAPEGSDLLDPAELGRIASPDQSVVATLSTQHPDNIWTIASTPAAGNHLILAGRNSTRAFLPADQFRERAFWALIPVSLLALGGGAFLSYRAMKPVRDLAATASRIVETGELDRRVPPSSTTGDLADLALLFNQMLDRNQSLIRAMRESLDNTAHDLRTPMARMRATAETALSETADGGAVREALADCVEESDRVLTMLDTLMDIAEAETGVMQLRLDRVNLSAIVDQVLELYEIIAEEKPVTLDAKLPDLLEIEADRVRLQQAIANLVDNAVKYGKPGGRVRVVARTSGDEAVIEVLDDGVGIETEDLPRIWDRLYRADRSRSERGLGLGLSFVKAIVDAHGGTITVDSVPGERTCFQIRLPLDRATTDTSSDA